MVQYETEGGAQRRKQALQKPEEWTAFAKRRILRAVQSIAETLLRPKGAAVPKGTPLPYPLLSGEVTLS